MTVCLNYDIEMLHNLKALYKYTDRFLTILSLVGASSRPCWIERERETDRQTDRDWETERDRGSYRDRDTQRHRDTERETQRDTHRERQRQLQRQRHRETQRVTQRETHSERHRERDREHRHNYAQQAFARAQSKPSAGALSCENEAGALMLWSD